METGSGLRFVSPLTAEQESFDFGQDSPFKIFFAILGIGVKESLKHPEYKACIKIRRLFLTVYEMLSIPWLKGLRVIAGHQGLTSQITTVSVMDAPDIYWVRR